MTAVQHIEGATEFAGKIDGSGTKESQKVSKLPYDLLPLSFAFEDMDAAQEPSVDGLIVSIMAFGEGNSGALHGARRELIELFGERFVMETTTQVLAYGAKKYAGHNWRKGMKWSYLIAAALRHLYAIKWGEDLDPETGLSHYGHFGCCLAFLIEYQTFSNLYGHMDDRFIRPAS